MRNFTLARTSLFSILMVPLLLWGCSDGSSSPTEPLPSQGSAIVDGLVVDNTTGSSTSSGSVAPRERAGRNVSPSLSSMVAASGVEGIRVSVQGTSISVMTDSTGRFLLEGVPSGNIQLVFENGTDVASLGVQGVQPVELIELTVRLQGATVVVESMERGSDSGNPNDGGGSDDGDDGDGGGDGSGGGDHDLNLVLEIQPGTWNTQWSNSSGTVTARVTGEGFELIDVSTVLLVGSDALADALEPQRVDVNGGQLRAFFDKAEALAILDDPQPGEEHELLLTFEVDGEAYELMAVIRIVGPATGGEAGIRIEKSTNGFDADRPTGPTIPVGDPVIWEYFVINTGDAALLEVIVVDDQGVEVICRGSELAVGASMTCTGEGIAEAGQYANTGSVTAVTEAGDPVSDEDMSHYFGEDDPGGNDGEGACGLGYWKNHHGAWPPTGYAPDQSVESVFAASAVYPDIAAASLAEALAFGGGSGAEGGARILLKQAVAALLNAAHPDVDYALDEGDVIAMVDAALASENRSSMTSLADELDDANEGECSLD